MGKMQLTSLIGDQSSYLNGGAKIPQTCEPHLGTYILNGYDLVWFGPPQGDSLEPIWVLTVLVDRATKCFATAEGYKRQSQVTPNPS